MKTFTSTSVLLVLTLIARFTSNAQSVGFNNPTPHASALVDMASDEKGLLIPRMTTVQRDAISAPATGLYIFNNDNQIFKLDENRRKQ